MLGRRRSTDRVEAAEDAAEEAAERAEQAAEVATTEAERSVEAAEAAEHSAESAGSAAEPDSGLGRPGPPFNRRSPFYVGFVGALGALLAYWLFEALLGIGSVLLLVVVSMFLAAGLNPAVEFIERRGVRRSWACALVIFAVLATVGLFVVAIVPVLTDQVTTLTANAPEWFARLQENSAVQRLDEEFDIVAKAEEYVANGDFISGLFGGVLGFGLQVLSVLFNIFVVVVLTLYFLGSLNTTKSALYRLAPASRRDRVTALGDRVVTSIGAYVSGAFLVAVCAGVTSLVFLYFAGLGEYAIALSFVVALLDLIPMIGATLGAVIVTAIGTATDYRIGIACAIFYVVYQQVENYVIYPRVMSRTVDLPGAVIVIAALVGTALLGVVGALLAVPSAAAVLLIVREVVVKQQDQR